MAPTIRPVIFWMVLSAVLFFAGGVVDGVYPGGANWSLEPGNGAPWIAYAFAIVELLLAALIIRGSDLAFFLAFGVATFFILERPITPLMVPYTTPVGYAVHLVTAVVQVLTMFSALRVFRLLRGYLESATTG